MKGYTRLDTGSGKLKTKETSYGNQEEKGGPNNGGSAGQPV